MSQDREQREIPAKDELQRFKMAWLAAEESGDKQAQVTLMHDLSNHPNEQAALVDFIAAYYATSVYESEPLLPMTQRANATALERVLGAPVAQAEAQAQTAKPQFATLSELRKARNLTKQATARGLRLSTDVWEQFERGTIELVSLSQQQLERLAQFFQVGADQFGTLLTNSTPTFVLNRRQKTKEGEQEDEPKKQQFKRVVSRSTMSAEDKQFWLS